MAVVVTETYLLHSSQLLKPIILYKGQMPINPVTKRMTPIQPQGVYGSTNTNEIKQCPAQYE